MSALATEFQQKVNAITNPSPEIDNAFVEILAAFGTALREKHDPYRAASVTRIVFNKALQLVPDRTNMYSIELMYIDLMEFAFEVENEIEMTRTY